MPWPFPPNTSSLRVDAETTSLAVAQVVANGSRRLRFWRRGGLGLERSPGQLSPWRELSVYRMPAESRRQVSDAPFSRGASIALATSR